MAISEGDQVINDFSAPAWFSGGYSGNELILKRGLRLRRVYTHKNWQIMATLTGHSISRRGNNTQYYAARWKQMIIIQKAPHELNVQTLHASHHMGISSGDQEGKKEQWPEI